MSVPPARHLPPEQPDGLSLHPLLQLAGVVVGVPLALVLWLLLGWLLMPVLGLLVALDAFGFRALLVGRWPSLATMDPSRVGLVSASVGLIAWSVITGLALLSLQVGTGQAQRAPRPAVAKAATAVPPSVTAIPPSATRLPGAGSEPTVASRPAPRATVLAATAAGPSPAGPTPTPGPLRVIHAGSAGASLRFAPETGERIKSWPDGTQVLPLGSERQEAGRTWIKVRDPDGNEGWMAAAFLARTSAVEVVAPGGTAGPGSARLPSRRAQPGRTAGTVVMITDGDTLVLELGGTLERTRLIGIDTPETKHPSKPVQCYGPEATARTAELVLGKAVEAELDVEPRDPEGRLLAYIWLAETGQMLNLQLAAEGYARPLTIPPNVAYTRSFVAAAASAREQNLGLWASCGYGEQVMEIEPTPEDPGH